MASVPPPPGSNNPGQSGDRDREQGNASSSRAYTPTMSSEDSDTVLLNAPGDRANESTPTDQSKRPPAMSRSSTFDIKKCWICIGDSTEDDPQNPPVWRSPCTCNLTAHERCLLDWVANLEHPRNSKRRPSARILCPQCKAEIKIARPKSYVVDATKAVDGALGRMVWPGVGLGLLGTVWAGAWIHGFQSVYLVFGVTDAEHIFQQANRHRGWQSAYALIPFNLIFARTNYADFVLPSGTLFLLATQISDVLEIDMTIWPPLPSTVFACLPAIRSGYNWCYRKAFGKLNQKWLEEIMPRQVEDVDGQEGNPADRDNRQEDEAGERGLVLQLEVNLGVNGDFEDQEAGNPAGGAENGNENNANGNEAQNGHVHQLLGERGDEIVESSSGIGQTILGALALPAVAAGMGQLLSLAIPGSWMSDTNWMNGRPGLLRNKWGRSVVGGCLFVVLKDALVLYCRWRLAQSHRSRRVMDYDKKTKKYSV